MRNIFLFIRRFSTAILFLVLQGVAIWFLITYNKFYRAKGLGVANEVTGWFNTRYNTLEDFFKMKREDVLGKKLVEAFPVTKGSQSEKDLVRALGGETIHNAAYRSSVTGKYYENFISPLKDETGKVYAAIGIAHDITDVIESTEKIKLSEEKYCSVSAMLQKSATISWRYEILPSSAILGHARS